MWKILIANRGEIALRIARAARVRGIKTVGVYTPPDRSLIHLKFVDEKFMLNDVNSYLNIEEIISAGRSFGCDAIHPGYGFLSENSIFSKRVTEEGMIFIGPDMNVLEKSGDKVGAKKFMGELGIETIPGIEGDLSADDVLEFAESSGYPILIKARYGGGGRGLRVIRSRDGVHESLEQAKKEALQAFGDGSIYVEKYFEHPRHIEMQFASDGKKSVYLGERECTIQRKHQKLVEEAPSPAVNDEIREALGRNVVKGVDALSYRGIGTMEFLLDAGRFYFMEINARVQVEHGVTEMVTGTDLIDEQFSIFLDEQFNMEQKGISIRGHAMETRINAENPYDRFIPVTGTVIDLHLPGGNGIRVDTHLYPGYSIPPQYDSLLAKVITYSSNRTENIAKMKSALDELSITGITTTVPLHKFIMNDRDFAAGNIDTTFIERKLPLFEENSASHSFNMMLAALSLLALEKGIMPIKREKESNWRIYGKIEQSGGFL